MDANVERFDLPDADVQLHRGWLSSRAADALFARLLHHIPWKVHHIRMFGRDVASPRLSCWIGDPGADYRYSGTRFAPNAWPDALRDVRTRLAGQLGVAFNSALANRYRDGRDAMGWHSDDERELGQRPLIASLSLGATRRFLVKQRKEGGNRLAVDLPHGSLLVMAGDTQAHYKHALPRTAKAVGERINLTFRRID